MEHFHSFETRQALADALADAVAGALTAAIKARGRASLAVSGGSTPKLFFATLSTRPLPWEKVTVTLVDERFVPPESDRSNHNLLAAHLLTNAAAKARFVPLYHAGRTAEEAAVLASRETCGIDEPFDVAILGMGTDGHTASFFPGGDNLAEALDAAATRGVVTIRAPDAGEPRLTFTFSALRDARFLALHIEGEEKKRVLEAARAEGREEDMPIRAVLNRSLTPLEIFWAP
ncbi:6-phosphogluconolactonase [Rhizobiaceae bacterium BDR2-2]|uniref:6-phosphogluconolactonase n=1 Tax=Ectorhizobium quercum TaxID=2965071 RepID=A0AAE3MXK3_9HYPH|nr:6-phosphogluconolactonase [Ectorhizobium quercum]MCX8996147.1 6-phosphogluconolactonase [Ectorhizobium quercum]MCX8998814.1 6-phosphogluconolactonase [Ectorhizobium quercum]